MKKKYLAIVLTIGTFMVGCKHSVEPVMHTGPQLPAAMFPDSITVDGGVFSTSTGAWTGYDTTIHSMLSYVFFPGISSWEANVGVRVNGDSVYESSQPHTTHYLGESQAWVIDTNSTYEVPNISHSIRAVNSFSIDTPLMADSLSLPISLKWDVTTDSASGVIILVSPSDVMAGDTVGLYTLQPADVGSYTLTSTDLPGLPLGRFYNIQVLRYVRDILPISSKNYFFFNSYESTVQCYIH